MLLGSSEKCHVQTKHRQKQISTAALLSEVACCLNIMMRNNKLTGKLKTFIMKQVR